MILRLERSQHQRKTFEPIKEPHTTRVTSYFIGHIIFIDWPVLFSLERSRQQSYYDAKNWSSVLPPGADICDEEQDFTKEAQNLFDAIQVRKEIILCKIPWTLANNCINGPIQYSFIYIRSLLFSSLLEFHKLDQIFKKLSLFNLNTLKSKRNQLLPWFNMIHYCLR